MQPSDASNSTHNKDALPHDLVGTRSLSQHWAPWPRHAKHSDGHQPFHSRKPSYSPRHGVLLLLALFLAAVLFVVADMRALLSALFLGAYPAVAQWPTLPQSGNALWYRTPGDYWSTSYLPVGNGILAGMVQGGSMFDQTMLNIESLWSGGPFSDPNYDGGNPAASQAGSLAATMQSIRDTIFSAGTIDSVNNLTTPVQDYGDFTSPGVLGVAITSPTGDVSDFMRWLDLDVGVARTTFSLGNGTSIFRETFCSSPAGACFQLTNSTSTTPLALEYSFNTISSGAVSCFDNSTLQLRGTAGSPGMAYEILLRLELAPSPFVNGNSSDGAGISCVPGDAGNATLAVSGAQSVWATWVGGTEWDGSKGTAADSYSFKGPDPHDALLALLGKSTSSSSGDAYQALLAAHENDVRQALTGNGFSLSLGQTVDTEKSTAELVQAYAVDTGNPYLEWLAFNLGRWMLVASSREASGTRLPANLQGKWSLAGQAPPWSADYHSNINIQMNYWSAEMTALDVTGPLWDYFQNNWAPRGAETAQILYNISQGWVTHNEMNIFGYTSMKGDGSNTAQWADYPESNVWMMIHVWDHFDFTQDVDWWKSQGWPLLKGVTQFHLEKLLADEYFNDGTLVTNPCNSPEQPGFITLGCAHQQQMIWQLFNAVEKGYDASGDTDQAFLQEVLQKRDQMDKGIHIGSWGQLQEWKIDHDDPSDTHRHLSHLIGLYPGYALASYAGQTNLTKDAVLAAAEISLIHRGNGTGPDGDTGWEKAWRAACWAQLGNATEFYHELTYTIFENFGPNLFSLYSPHDPDPIFQIDANLGFPGAVLNALVQAPDVPYTNSTLIITLLPALPSTWSSGAVTGLRIRGGLSLDMQWSDGRPTSGAVKTNSNAAARSVSVMYKGSQVSSFTVSGGSTQTLSFGG